MANQVVSIIGDRGFESLYARSLFLVKVHFPCIASALLGPQADIRFANLKSNLEAQTPAQASEANAMLLVTLTDILASLIGEDLTTSILYIAWGDRPPDHSSKEAKNKNE